MPTKQKETEKITLDPIDEFFKDIPAEVEVEVELPSRGKFYSNTGPTLTLRPINFEDEKSLALAEGTDSGSINLLLSRCVKNFNIQNLLSIDKLALIVKLRAISYGKTFEVTHPCEACKTENQLVYDLEKIPLNKIPEDFEDPRLLYLPTLKKDAYVRMAKVSDEMPKASQERQLNSLWRFVTKIGDLEDPVLISKLLQDPRFPIADIHRIAKAMAATDYGLDTDAKYSCVECKNVNTISLPLNADFFSVK